MAEFPYLLTLAVLAAGAGAGFLGGLFGIGGGIVTVPALYAVFRSAGYADGPSLKTAIGTSLAVIVVTSIRSLMTHHKTGKVDWRLLRAWLPWIAIGAASGGFASRYISGDALALIFALVAGAFGLRRLQRPQREDKAVSAGAPFRDLTRGPAVAPIGVGTGLFSSIMGLGGGAVGVMLMTNSGRSMHEAVATASGFGVAVAAPGAAAFAIAGLGAAGLPPFSFGFVNGAAFALMSVTGALLAPIGARLAHRTQSALLSRLFGAYIAIMAILMIIDVVS